MLGGTILFFLLGTFMSTYGRQVYRQSDDGVWLEARIMTWNILAPMWVDRDALTNAGMVDTNLLNEKIRLWRIAQQIKREKPDIVALQEVQEDIFEELSKELEKNYATVGLAPNEKDYWKEFLAEGATYKGNRVVEEATKVAMKYDNENPTVFILGDMNSMEPYDGFLNIARRGFLDAQREVGNVRDFTYFFEPPFMTAGGAIHGGAIDHIFLRTADVEEGRAKFSSAEIPAVTSNESSEETYVKDITRLLKMNFRHEAIKGAGKMIPRLLKSDIFSSLYNAVHEDKKKEYNINRVLRRGSDHLFLTATVLIRDWQK